MTARRPYRYQSVRLPYRGTRIPPWVRYERRHQTVAFCDTLTGNVVLVRMRWATPEFAMDLLSHEAIHMAIQNFITLQDEDAYEGLGYHETLDIACGSGPVAFDRRRDPT